MTPEDEHSHDAYFSYQLRRCPNKDFWDVYGVDRDGCRWIVGKSVPHTVIAGGIFAGYEITPEEESKEVE